MSRAVDPRLLRHAQAARGYLVFAIGLGAEGRVVQRGTHQELMCAGGAYRDMWSAQVRC